MIWIWSVIGILAVTAGVRHQWRRHAARSARGAGAVDDAAIQQIIDRGELTAGDGSPPLDMRAAAEAEEEFWAETWDEPEEL